jgi:spore coat polysaccharide biosynthesis protein SpsF
MGVGCFRGSEHDVLGRFVGAIQLTNADVIVRITGDCPLIDPFITDKVVNDLISHTAECDYVSNTIQRTYPRGLDVEALFSDTLFRVNRLAKSDLAREHVTTFIYVERPDLFLIRSVTDNEDNSAQRWTVDTYADLEFTRKIYNDLDLKENVASYQQILNYVQAHPELSELNADGKTWNPLKPVE